ncbi:MAG: hypothetical protein ACOYOF_10025 [Verrucomicrobiaceae bacterium]
MKKTLLALAAVLLGSTAAQAAFVTVGTATENRITSDTRWTRDNVYILSRVIFVTNGAVLTIEPGTIVRGVTTTLSGYSAEPGVLLIARGAKIIANGTADDPIIFTSIDDPMVPGGVSTIPSIWKNTKGTNYTITGAGRHVSLARNNYTPEGPVGDNGFSKAARWGGVVICGNAYISQGTSATDAGGGLPAAPATFGGITSPGSVVSPNDARLANKGQNQGLGSDYVEGLSTENGSNILNSALAIYGGTNDADNSGVMRFCSLRYGGFVLGTGNEINGLTICGAGSGSVFEHIEVFQNQDDGFEWFGGKHDTRFLYSLANQDDGFDGDEGYRGNNQFWTVVQGTQNQLGSTPARSGFTLNQAIGNEVTGSDYNYDKLIEWDGGESDNNDRLPQTIMKVWNMTAISGGTLKNGLNAKLEAQVFVNNVVVENTKAVSIIANNGGVAPAFGTLLTWDNIHSFDTTVTGATEVGSTSGLVQTTALVEESATNLSISPAASSAAVASAIYKKNGLDLRLKAGAAARTEDGPNSGLPANIIEARFAGSMLDNNQLAGWSVLNRLQVLPTTNVARPAVSIGMYATNPTVSFSAAAAALKYVIEKSSDQKTWTPVTTLTGTAGTVTHTDTTTTIGSTPVFYRVYAL